MLDRFSPQLRHNVLLGIAAILTIVTWLLNAHILDNVIPQGWLPVIAAAATWAIAFFTPLIKQYGLFKQQTQIERVVDEVAPVVETVVETATKKRNTKPPATP